MATRVARGCSVLGMRRLWASGCALGVCFAFLSGCSTTSGKLKARYAREQGCSEDRVFVVDESGTVYRASGCGSETEYVCESFAGLGDSASRCSIRGANPRVPTGDPPPQNTYRPEYSPPK